ncbi:hypothetical protein [Dietzia sp.]|uniref:hypothetical protein n=1 Tax=Dietzia sp. TaxID=1871616 RepID=UPI002FDB35BF
MLSSFRSRVAAVAAASALALGAGLAVPAAANAVTNSSAVDGTKVSVTFSLEQGEVSGNCYAALAPTAIAPQFIEQVTGGLDRAAAYALFTRDDVTTLKTGGRLPLPTAVLFPAASPSVTLSASDIPANVYSLVTYCVGDTAPGVDPTVVVGNPADAVLGSIQAGSSQENLAAASASLPTIAALLAGDGI